jgi:hippurate hydrolase
MGGEDFALMLLERPGAFMFLEISDETKPRYLHFPTYNFNDEAITLGVAY